MRRDAGFTLLELLVALVVLGFILAGLSQGVRYGLRATGTQARTIAAQGDLDAVDRALRRLIEQMEPGTPQDTTVQGTANRLAFVSDLPDAALAQSAGRPTRRADIALGVDDARRLVLRASPRPAGRPFAPPPPPFETELLRDVERIELSYWPRGPAPRWLSSWTVPALPLLVRLRVVFPQGDRRRWPDIVMGTRREQPPAP